jgi:hypothetical protein
MRVVRFALKFPYTFHVLDTFMSAHPLRPPLNFRHDVAASRTSKWATSRHSVTPLSRVFGEPSAAEKN